MPQYGWQSCIDKLRRKLEVELDLDDYRPLTATLKIMCVKNKELGVIDWRPQSCYSCKHCVAGKWHLCKGEGCGPFCPQDLEKDA